MTNEQILDQQVEALEKLLQLKQAIIDELEKKVSQLEAIQSPWANPGWVGGGPIIGQPAVQSPYIQPFIGGGGTTTIIVSNTCPDGTPHEFPFNLSGTSNCCEKCGHYSGSITNVTLADAKANGATSNVFTLNDAAAG